MIKDNGCDEASPSRASSSDVFGGIPGAVWLCGLLPMLDAAELSACRAGCQGLAKCLTDLTVAKTLGEMARRRLVAAMGFGMNVEDDDQVSANTAITTALRSMAQVNAMELESLVESAPYAGSQSISAVLALTEVLLGEVTPSFPPGSMLVWDANANLQKLCHFDCGSLEPSVILRLRRHAPAKPFCDWLEPQREQPRALTALQLLIHGVWELYAPRAALWESVAATATISDGAVKELRQSVRHGIFIERFCGLLNSPARTKRLMEESKGYFPYKAPQQLNFGHNRRQRTSQADKACSQKPQHSHQQKSWGGHSVHHGRRRHNKKNWY
jgi:hypothetical protein